MTTFLENRFAFFFMRREKSGESGKDSQGYASSINKIGSFDSVEGFFGIYDHLVKVSDLDTANCVTDYHLFREGITPTWEDAKNKRGGKWIVRLRKVEGLSALYFEELLLALIGEQFGNVGIHVCGVVASCRTNEDIISVWNADAEDKDATNKIRDCIKEVLDLPNFVTLEYKRHQFARQQQWNRGDARGPASGDARANPHHKSGQFNTRGPPRVHSQHVRDLDTRAPPTQSDRDWSTLRRK